MTLKIARRPSADFHDSVARLVLDLEQVVQPVALLVGDGAGRRDGVEEVEGGLWESGGNICR